MVCIVSSCICHIFQNIISWKLITISNCKKSLWSESSFCINIETFPFPTALINRELTSNCKRMTQLCLACAELPKYFSYWTCFNATSQKTIQFCRASCQLDYFRTFLMELSGSSETHRYQLWRFCLQNKENKIHCIYYVLKFLSMLHLKKRLHFIQCYYKWYFRLQTWIAII